MQKKHFLYLSKLEPSEYCFVFKITFENKVQITKIQKKKTNKNMLTLTEFLFINQSGSFFVASCGFSAIASLGGSIFLIFSFLPFLPILSILFPFCRRFSVLLALLLIFLSFSVVFPNLVVALPLLATVLPFPILLSLCWLIDVDDAFLVTAGLGLFDRGGVGSGLSRFDLSGS